MIRYPSSSTMLKTNEIVEIVHLDIRSQMTLMVYRSIRILNEQYRYDPPFRMTSDSFYRKIVSNTKSNTITPVLHCDGASFTCSRKQSI